MLLPFQDLHPKDRAVTLGEIRKLLEEQSQKAIPPPPKPAIEYKPTYKDPPLNPVTPGNGMSSGQEAICSQSHLQVALPAVSKYRSQARKKATIA